MTDYSNQTGTALNIYQFVADTLLISHALFIGFVVFGLVLILMGMFRKWRWIRNPWFRSLHLAAIGTVILQSWLDIACPLTVWENYFREKAVESVYPAPFIQHWLHQLIFFQAESWVFTLCYSLFGGLVLATWYFVPPDFFKKQLGK